MKFFGMPGEAIRRHREALAEYVRTELTRLRASHSDGSQKHIRDYIDCLYEQDDGKSIVVKTIDELDRVVDAVERVKGASPGADWTSFEDELAAIFDYEHKFRDASDWNSGKYIELLMSEGLQYCPYCNTKPLEAYPVVPGGDGYHKGPLDHFYDKSDYPYLALSIYNLIPVCERCNTLKGKKSATLKTHSHPFRDDFHDLEVFEVKSGDPFAALFGAKGVGDVTIKLSERGKDRSSAATALADIVEIRQRYNLAPVKAVAGKVLRSGERYKSLGAKFVQGLTSLKGVSELDAIAEEFGVKVDGSDINRQEFGKLRNDLMPEGLKRLYVKC